MSAAPRRAWVTLLTQPGYLVGVRVLARSLRASGSPHPLVVMVTAGVDDGARAVLAADGCQVREVEPVVPDAGLEGGYARARFAEVWTKLAAWRLTDLDRVVFLDADMLVVRPMDDLFDVDLGPGGVAASHACRCNPDRVAGYPQDWTPEHCHYTHHPDAGRAGWAPADAAPAPADGYLNAGLLVLEPDEAVLAALMERVAAAGDPSRYPFAEQDLLNEHFAGRWRVLPWARNAPRSLPVQHPDAWDPQVVRNVHYIGDKPWEKPFDPADRHHAVDALWWEAAAPLGVVPGAVA